MDKIKEIKPRDFALEQVKWYIQSQKLGPHSKLPSERELCKMWGLNRSTLHSALKTLVEEGVIYMERGSGTYVAPPKYPIHLKDAKSLTQAFKGSGSFLWTEVLQTQLMEANDEIAQKLNILPGDLVFYIKRARKKNNITFRVEESFLNYKLCPGIESMSFTDQSLFKVLKGYGLALDCGEEVIGITKTTEENAAILGIDTGEDLYEQKGITVDKEKRIVEYFKIQTRADLIHFTSVLYQKEDDNETGGNRK